MKVHIVDAAEAKTQSCKLNDVVDLDDKKAQGLVDIGVAVKAGDSAMPVNKAKKAVEPVKVADKK